MATDGHLMGRPTAGHSGSVGSVRFVWPAPQSPSTLALLASRYEGADGAKLEEDKRQMAGLAGLKNTS